MTAAALVLIVVALAVAAHDARADRERKLRTVPRSSLRRLAEGGSDE